MTKANQNPQFPPFPDWENLATITGEGSFFETQELRNLNETLLRTLLNLKEISRQLTHYERKKAELELAYKRKYRKAISESHARTEALKKQYAELLCEEEEFDLAYLTEIIRELNRISTGLRTDLDILKTLGFNLRQEMKL